MAAVPPAVAGPIVDLLEQSELHEAFPHPTHQSVSVMLHAGDSFVILNTGAENSFLSSLNVEKTDICFDCIPDWESGQRCPMVMRRRGNSITRLSQVQVISHLERLIGLRRFARLI